MHLNVVGFTKTGKTPIRHKHILRNTKINLQFTLSGVSKHYVSPAIVNLDIKQ